MSTRVFILAAALGSLASSACFAIADLGRFEEGKDKPTTAANSISEGFANLKVSLSGMGENANDRMELRVVDGSNIIRTRIIIAPLGGADATLAVPLGVPRDNGPFRLDFFADHDNSGTYSASDGGADQAWRVPLEVTTPDGFDVTFARTTTFAALDAPSAETDSKTGTPLLLHLRQMEAFVGKRVEIRLTDSTTKQQVALYRLPALKVAEADIEIPGMIEPNSPYAIEVYSDDGAPAAANPRAFRFSDHVGTPTGVEETFTGANPAPVPQVNDFVKAL